MSLILRAEALTRRYANGVLANDGVSLRIERGHVHAILGENGAGKSTLMKMLYGLERPDSGAIVFDGRKLLLDSPARAIAAGIGLVPQHPQLVGSLTVAQNMLLGNEPRRSFLFDKKRARDLASEIAERHNMRIDVDAPVSTLSVGLQQRVEILKALRRGVRLLLLDEPTALLTPHEAESLFDSLRELTAAGVTLGLITHKLGEVKAMSQAYTVMRRGCVVAEGATADVDERQLAALVVGDHSAASRTRRPGNPGRSRLLSVRNLEVGRDSGRAELSGLSFDIAQGEVVGIAAVEGNGQEALCRVLSGHVASFSGRIEFAGGLLPSGAVRDSRRHGIGCIPANRMHEGMAPGFSVAQNTAALDYFAPPQSRRGVLDPKWIAMRARRLVHDMGVAAKSEHVPMGSLSGGNIQKVVVGTELLAGPRLLIAQQPTHGVDVGAARSLRTRLLDARDEGMAMLLVSADLDELLELSDRVMVLFEGRLVAHFDAATTTPRELGLYMTGARCEPDCTAKRGAPFTQPTAAHD